PAGGPAEDLHVRATTRAGAGDDVGLAVAVDVAGCHRHAAVEVDVVGHEAHQQRPVLAAEDLDLRPTPGAGADDDVRGAVAVDVGRGDVDAAAEGGVERHEAHQQRAGLAVEDLDLRPAAGAGADDDVRHAVAVDIAAGHPHAAEEARGEGVELEFGAAGGQVD